MNASRSSKSDKNTSNPNGNDLSELNLSFDESVLQLMDEPFEPKVNSSKLRTDFKYNGFDSTMGDTWIYPTNYPIRQYQMNVSRVSLFKNTMVVLPTGLGKTFIASVVMYNIFRWYPKGKIIFMAPTRPLVAQQIDACYQIMGFPKDETVELTGRQNKKVRFAAWHSKRVFYCTPQVVWSDMSDSEINFPFNDIKLIVVDEAHKAKGKYAYTEVVQSIWTRNKLFRVLALSATPGRNIKDVCEVIQNLLISNVEVRRENSIDVAPYVFKKNIKTVVVPLGEQLTEIRKRLHELVEPYVENLMKHQVIAGHTGNLTKAWLLFDRNKFRESTISNRHPEQSSINCDFSVCISLYHAIELLERHGMRVFLNYFNDNNPDSSAEEKFFVLKDPMIKKFINEIRSNTDFAPIPEQDMSFHGNLSNIDFEPIDFGHPKFGILQNCLTDHFKEHSDTKAIVFCEYRESVFLINRMLLENRPLIKPKVFVGQGTSHNRTITQKEQIAIMNDFRSGKCNVLIATCVAEEGIDVGEVDFIVCFDVNNKNPIRFVQRIGRTGRKRQGKVTMLVTEGKEQQILKEILATKDGINQRIAKSNEIKSVLYKDCPRLVPPEFNPQCTETYIDIKNTQEPSTSKKSMKKGESKKKPAKTKIPKTTTVRKGDMRQFFKPIDIDDEIEENFDLSSYRNTSAEHTATHLNNNSNVPIDDEHSFTENLITTSRNESDSCRAANDQVKTDSVQTNEVPLKVKFEKVYSHYCELKERRAKWNGLNDNVNRAIDSNQLPSIITDFIVKCQKESNENRIYRTNVNQWPFYSDKKRIQILQLMSLLTKQTIKTETVVESQQLERDDSAIVFQSNNTANNLIESQLSCSVHLLEHQSKYASQLKSEQKLQAMQIASSTPHKTSNLRQMMALPMQSPIVNKMPTKKSKYNKDDPNWYLKYLGLNTVHDLFSDGDDDGDGDDADNVHEKNENRDVNNKSDEQQAKLCDNLNKSICGNDSLIEEEESQFTVSRILKICDDAEYGNGAPTKSAAMQTPPPSTATTRRKRLYIGSVNDLFCHDDDDDDDDDEDNNVIINTQAIDSSLTESDDTVNYDVEDAMAHHRNLHNSTDLFRDTTEGGTSDKLINMAAKTVACTRSDELFSTYNESMPNISKANTTNVSEHVKHQQSIHETPKKSSNTSLFTYHCRSPSMLIKSTSVLSTQNNQSNRMICNTSKTSSNDSSKSPSALDTKLSMLNSQLSLSKHFEDFEEIKENFSSPFVTCRSPKRIQKPSQLHETNSNCDTELSGDDIFATCKPVSNSFNNRTQRRNKTKRKPKRKFNFIDDEARVSGDESSDDDDFIATQASSMADEFEEDDPSVDMQAKYLESIRSPAGKPNFRIPKIGYRNPVATQNIFSQFVEPDHSKYERDSFVVSTDEEGDSDCTVCSDEEVTDLDEITIVPTRSNKRKSDETKSSKFKKRRRIIEFSSESE